MRALLALSLLLSTSSPAFAKPTCATRVEDFRAWLATAGPAVPALRDQVALVDLPAELAERSELRRGQPVVVVEASRITFDGRELWKAGESLDEGRDRVRFALRARLRADDRLRSAILAVSRDASFAQVVAVADAVLVTELGVELAFAVPRRLPAAPPASKLGDRLTALRGELGGVLKLTRELLATCPGAEAALQAGDAAGVAAAMPPALLACKCKPSPEDLRVWFWHVVFEGNGTAARSVGLPGLVRDSEGVTVIRAPADARWETLAGQVAGARGRFALGVDEGPRGR